MGGTSAGSDIPTPMLATAGPLPTGPGWAFEFKWDGVRAVAQVARGRVRLCSRNARDITASYPELQALADLLAGRNAILDGEIVALDAAGVPSFARLQQRMHVQRPARHLLAAVPTRLYVFDVLALDGRRLTDLPYRQRRDILEGLAINGPAAQTPPSFLDAGDSVMHAAREAGLEGVVAKRLDSPYKPGRRTRQWIKTPLEQTTEVVIAGWKPGAGRRAGTIGSLLLGAYDRHGALVYLGHVGTGFTQQALDLLQRQLRPLARRNPPFDTPVPREHARDARWVRPILVGEVVYRTLTPDGRLRHPSWRGLRPDRDAREVRVRRPA